MELCKIFLARARRALNLVFVFIVLYVTLHSLLYIQCSFVLCYLTLPFSLSQGSFQLIHSWRTCLRIIDANSLSSASQSDLYMFGRVHAHMLRDALTSPCFVFLTLQYFIDRSFHFLFFFDFIIAFADFGMWLAHNHYSLFFTSSLVIIFIND